MVYVSLVTLFCWYFFVIFFIFFATFCWYTISLNSQICTLEMQVIRVIFHGGKALHITSIILLEKYIS